MRNFAISLFLLLALSATAATYCIGPSGTGTGSGADWSNLKAWSGTPARGDTWYLVDGSYSSKAFSTALSGTTYITIKKATVADHAGISTGWSDTMGDGQADFGHSIVISTGYWIFDGVTGSSWDPTTYGFKINQPADCSDAQYYFTLGTGSGATISHIILAHTYAKACPDDTEKMFIDLNPSDHQANHTYTNLLADGFQGLVFMFGLDTGWIENCRCTNTFTSESHHGDTINMRVSFDGCKEITIKNNQFADYNGTGCIVANDAFEGDHSCDGLYVYGNYFGPWAGGSGGNGVITPTTHAYYNNVHVFNNTFNGCGNPWLVSCMDAASSGNKALTEDFYATNNIIYNTSNAGIEDSVGAVADDYNTYVSCTGQATGGGNVSTGTSPFVDAAGHNFNLSAAVAGVTLDSTYNLDPAGVTRGADGTWDRGAYEFDSGDGGGGGGGGGATYSSGPITVTGAAYVKDLK